MSKTIQELVAEMTKEEFIKMMDQNEVCPNNYNLVERDGCSGDQDLDTCHKCWEMALQGITFKQPLSVMEKYLPVLEQLQEAEMQYKQLDEHRKKLKEQLQDVMETHGITKWENDEFSISYIAEGKPSTTLDSAAVKKKYPMVYEECSKPKAGTKAYVKFNIKM